MGVDCNIYLLPGTRVSHVADVIGRLFGLPTVQEPLDPAFKSTLVTRVNGIEVTHWGGYGLGACAKIAWKHHATEHQLTYHFEGSDTGERYMAPKSRAMWLAMGTALVDFFGGRLVYQDCHEHAIYATSGLPGICHENDESFDRRQLAIWNLKPLTIEDIDAMRPYAAYDDLPEDRLFPSRLLPSAISLTRPRRRIHLPKP